MKKFQTFHSSYCVSRSYFSEDESQNDLIFQPVLSYLRRLLEVPRAIGGKH